MLQPPIGAPIIAGACSAGCGVKQVGGVSGSVNAGSGILKGCKFSGSPSRFRQLPSLHSPPDPGNANSVVAGSGLKIRRPVGSTAGKRNREQPLWEMIKTTMLITPSQAIIDGAAIDRGRCESFATLPMRIAECGRFARTMVACQGITGHWKSSERGPQYL
ncbi:hypothetical protein [Roseiconus lacunae]|uniref:hypothetical protein n=1 Tax=Roseiconus lacunae TaxID=2605694 RepID=UPI001356EC28|nr:hypothetical protein [Roseiconus lacunae]